MRLFMALTAALAASLAAAQGQYGADYQKIIDAAKGEKTVVVYSSTDQATAQFLIDDFQKLYPFLKVQYNDIGTTQIYSRVIAEAAANTPGADFVWSSAMELQVKLATEGYALAYTSPELKNYAPENHIDNILYGTTLEPAALIYNKRVVKKLPSSHAEFAQMLQSGQYNGKVATWDPEKSGVGFTLLDFDSKVTKDFGAVERGLGKANAGLYSSTGAMLEKVSSGEAAFGYDIIASYALLRQQKVPDLGLHFWKDDTIAFQRPAFVSKSAAHPNAAKLFLDYLLSRRGQQVMANESLLYALRPDVAGKATPNKVYAAVGGKANLKVIPVSRELLKNLDQAGRSAFLNQWRQAVKGQ